MADCCQHCYALLWVHIVAVPAWHWGCTCTIWRVQITLPKNLPLLMSSSQSSHSHACITSVRMEEFWVANLGAMLFYTSSSTFLYICVPVSPVYLLVVMVHCAWACECQTGLKSILILQLKCLHTQCSPFLFAALRSERKQPRCTHWKQHGMEGVKTRGCCRFNEAIVRTTACFFQNSSQRCHLSPIEEMLWAMSVRGQERLPFILLYSWFRIKRG